MSEYDETVRNMKTSGLIACMTSTDAVREVVDPYEALDAQIVDIHNPGWKAAEQELARRATALVLAAGAELDRRIPIPEAS